MNTVDRIGTQASRHGSFEDGLRRGPVHIVKRNRPSAVVLTEEEYRQLMGERVTAADGIEDA
jgi:hypothetical protein